MEPTTRRYFDYYGRGTEKRIAGQGEAETEEERSETTTNFTHLAKSNGQSRTSVSRRLSSDRGTWGRMGVVEQGESFPSLFCFVSFRSFGFRPQAHFSYYHRSISPIRVSSYTFLLIQLQVQSLEEW